jgi:TolB-like protein/Tfp pilus assembly protein PilF
LAFFEELKRRNVIKVGIAYAVGAWLLLQLTDVLIDLLGLPDTAGKYVILLLVVGFPLALFFAWAFEMTPDGIRKEKDVDRTESITHVTSQKLNNTIITILVMALAFFVYDKFGSGSEPPNESETVDAAAPANTEAAEPQALEKSIAVMPFVNMSADADNEYFSDGLSEELLNLLAKVDGLKVAARTSTFKFKGKEVDIAEIGEQLNVATVLEGSVRRAGNTARITAQLIKVDDGFHLWSETYDRDLDNIFQVQDEIARAIVDALKLPLLGQGKTAIASTATSNFEAYDLYLLGRHHFRERNEAAFEKAADYFSRAVAIDPAYAPAWSGMAMAYLNMSDFGDFPRAKGISLAESAIDNALTSDPNLAEAYTAKANLLGYQSRTNEAMQAVKQALAINPNDINALGQLSGIINDHDPAQALVLVKKAYELDPLSEQTRVQMIGRMAGTGDLEGAEALLQEMLLSDPDNPGLHESRAFQYSRKGLNHLAISEYKLAHELRAGDVYPAWMVVLRYLAIDDLEAAMEWSEIARERGPGAIYTRSADRTINAYQKNHETNISEYLSMETQEDTLAGNEFDVALSMIKLGHHEQAEQLLRKTLRFEGTGLSEFFQDFQAEAAAQLINILDPAHPDRVQLLESLRIYVEHLLQVRSFDDDTYYFQAYLTTFEGDREATMTALRNAFDHGMRARWALEQDPIFQRWNSDPLFMELLLEMKQEATRMRELLRASEAAP